VFAEICQISFAKPRPPI
jgi:NifU-like protein involved in Fe-S cluster formation